MQKCTTAGKSIGSRGNNGTMKTGVEIMLMSCFLSASPLDFLCNFLAHFYFTSAEVNLWSSFIQRDSSILRAGNDDDNKEAKLSSTKKLEIKTVQCPPEGALARRSTTMDLLLKNYWTSSEKNVNENLWLLVISLERYARDEIFFLLLHISMLDYCHDS